MAKSNDTGLSSRIKANKFIGENDRQKDMMQIENQNVHRVISKVKDNAPFNQ